LTFLDCTVVGASLVDDPPLLMIYQGMLDTDESVALDYTTSNAKPTAAQFHAVDQVVVPAH
jgi:hypothetical protein